MYHPAKIGKLSHQQISKLLNGHRVRVKHGSAHTVHLSHEQHKRLSSASKKDAGIVLEFDPYQQAQHQHLRGESHLHHAEGEGGKRKAHRGRCFWDIAKSGLKAIAPIAIDEGGKYLKGSIAGLGPKSHRRKRGGDINDIMRKTLHTVEDVASYALPFMFGLREGGHRRRKRKIPSNRRKTTRSHRKKPHFHGESLFAAGY